MKKIILSAALIAVGLTSLAQVGIGTTTPHASSILEISSTTQAFLPTRMTETQMNAIVSPAEGLMVYCFDCAPKDIYVNDGTSFISLLSGFTTEEGAALEEVLEDSASADGANNANGIAVSYAELETIGVSGLIIAKHPDYQVAIAFETGFSNLPTVAEVQNIIDAVNAAVSGGGDDDVTGVAGRIWLNRDLGATQVATSSLDHLSYGDLYQWGRGSDGHQTIVWTSSATSDGAEQAHETTTTATSAIAGHGDYILGGAASDYSWTSFAEEDNLWQGVAGINNPCPTGYRIPTESEFETERINFATNDADGAFNSALKLPMAGLRHVYNNGVLIFVGGRYWSSTVSGVNSRSFNFDSSNAFFVVNSRGNALSVRCIKE